MTASAPGPVEAQFRASVTRFAGPARAVATTVVGVFGVVATPGDSLPVAFGLLGLSLVVGVAGVLGLVVRAGGGARGRGGGGQPDPSAGRRAWAATPATRAPGVAAAAARLRARRAPRARPARASAPVAPRRAPPPRPPRPRAGAPRAPPAASRARPPRGPRPAPASPPPPHVEGVAEGADRAGAAGDGGVEPVPLVPAAVALALVRAAEEALRNAERHSGAESVSLRLFPVPDGVAVTITDEGAGFDPSRVPAARRGVRGSVVERMSAAGGRRGPVLAGRGTTVTLRWARG